MLIIKINVNLIVLIDKNEFNDNKFLLIFYLYENLHD